MAAQTPRLLVPLLLLVLLVLVVLLLLLFLANAWAQLQHPVAVATFAGSLGLAAFLLVGSARQQKEKAGTPISAPKEFQPASADRLPLSSQISADYSDVDNGPLRGVEDLPPRLFRVIRQQANPLDFGIWRYAEQKANESVRVTHFAWTIPRMKGVNSVSQLESAEFRDAKMDGVSWRCQLRREPGGQRLLVLLKASRLDPGDFPEGRLFAEVTCTCEGVRKSTFAAFYPGVYEFALGLDSHRLGGTGSMTVACTVAVFVSVSVHQLAQLPTTCLTDDQGRYVNCHSVGIRWQISDWEQFAWETGWAIFSPLFSSASLPGYLWQVHLFPVSDDTFCAGHVSAFLKLIDSTVTSGDPVEVDFELTLQGDEDGALFDTVSFARGSTHGFRGIRKLGDLRGCPLLVECELRVKLPLFT